MRQLPSLRRWLYTHAASITVTAALAVHACCVNYRHCGAGCTLPFECVVAVPAVMRSTNTDAGVGLSSAPPPTLSTTSSN